MRGNILATHHINFINFHHTTQFNKGYKMQSIIKENYRPTEASTYLGVGLSTIWLYIKQGKLKAKKLSQRVTIIPKSELDSLLSFDEV